MRLPTGSVILPEVDSGISAFFIGLVCGMIAACGIVVGPAVSEISKLKTEAIERGHAQHNAKTGKWEWIEPSKEPPQ